MSFEWRDIAFGDFVALQRGHDLPDQERRPGNVPILGSFGVTGFHDTVKANGPGVTIGRSGASFGVAAYTDKDYWPLNTALYVTDFKGNDPKFVFYFFKEFDFSGYNSGSAQPSLNRNNLYGIPIRVPQASVQKQVAGFVSALDDRIALLRETNATLEAIAQALFKSWFVDFDPVRAKQQGREPEGAVQGCTSATEGRMSVAALDAETAALFPDSFEESELGLVPKGWRAGNIGDNTVYLSRGISPKYLEEGGVLVVNQKCIRDFILDLSKARRHDPVQRKIDGRELSIGDILVNSTGVGTLGRVAQVLSSDELMIVDSHVTVVRASENLTWNYLGLSMMRRQVEIERLGEGSTGQTELNRSKLAALKLIIPPKETLLAFDEVALPLRQRFAVNLKQAQTLATLRDTLLPRLISGQLRLPDAEALAGEAGA
ncbi:MAG: restriction endonuclease subunit S [Methylobacter tundripaludum]|nr:restriction endonuclease subunit S [Methylobacter tundripaludum]